MFKSPHWVQENKLAVLLIASLLAGGGVAGSIFWQASGALSESSDELHSESEIVFALVRLGESSPGAVHGGVGEAPQVTRQAAVSSTSNPFEWISTPALYTDAAEFDGALYVVGPAGVFAYSAEGALKSQFRVGVDLPASPPTAAATGLSTSKAGRALYVATAGEGLLILDSAAMESAADTASPRRARFRQVRAREAAYRDLTAVLPLKTGRVLLGSESKGVLVYDGERLTELHPNLANLHVTALAGDESSIWIGTLNKGLLRWQAGRLESFGEQDGLPDRQILTLELAGNRLFAGTALGVAEFRDGRFERELAEGFFATSLLARGESLLVGTFDEGVVEVPLDANRPRGPRLESHGVGDLEGVAVERLLSVGGSTYALARDGLYPLEAAAGDRGQFLERENAILTDRNVSALNVDSAGRIWVGYFDRGLDVLDSSLGRAQHIEDEHVFCVNRIVEDPKKGLTAVATANGLVMFDAAGRRQQLIGREEGLISNHVTDVWFSATGMIAATPAGITFVDGSGSRSLYAFQGLVNNHVYTLAAAGERLLAGTLGGLSVLDAGVVRTSYTTGNSDLKHNWITSIVAFDQEWFVGTYGAGVLRLDEEGRWHAFPDMGRPLEINPNAMAASEVRVYAGALDAGLYIYERTSGRWRVVTEGLPSANVTALEISSGYLYVGTDNGLVRIAEDAL